MVCLGNICRSPLAEGILKHKTQKLDVFIDSAGTASYHVGHFPDSRSIKIASKLGEKLLVWGHFEDNDYALSIKESFPINLLPTSIASGIPFGFF